MSGRTTTAVPTDDTRTLAGACARARGRLLARLRTDRPTDRLEVARSFLLHNSLTQLLPPRGI